MRFFIVGAGAVGSLAATMLAKEKAVSKVVCGDRDVKRARHFLRPGGKISLVKADASDRRSVASAAKGSDVVLNASHSGFNLTVMAAALEAGAHYQDLDSRLKDLRHAEQFRLDARFRRAGRTALINAGVSPGVTNLLAREASERLDRVDAVRIRLVEDQRSEKAFFSWSPSVTIDEISSPPLVYRNGRFALTEPFADEEEFDFAAPIGRRRVFSIFGDEVATLPSFLRTRNVDYKACGADIDLARTLRDLGLTRTDAVLVGGARVRPLDVLAKAAPPVPPPSAIARMVKDGSLRKATLAAAVEVSGRRKGRAARVRCSLSFPDVRTIARKAPGSTYVAFATAVSAASFALVIPGIDRPGVFPPEALGKRERSAVLRRLRREGAAVGCREM